MNPDLIELVCKDVVELVTGYLDRTLPVEDRIRLEQHLLTCPPCTAYLAQMRTTIELASDVGRAPTEEVGAELVALFRRWHGKGS